MNARLDAQKRLIDDSKGDTHYLMGSIAQLQSEVSNLKFVKEDEHDNMFDADALSAKKSDTDSIPDAMDLVDKGVPADGRVSARARVSSRRRTDTVRANEEAVQATLDTRVQRLIFIPVLPNSFVNG